MNLTQSLIDVLSEIVRTVWWLSVLAVALVIVRYNVVTAIKEVITLWMDHRKQFIEDLEKRFGKEAVADSEVRRSVFN